jgi:rubredoxin-NAD+ reductase
MSTAPIIIIGTGLAGYTVAKEFRKYDKETALRLLTADEGEFYSKPMLSNALSGNKTPEQLATFDAAAMSKQLNAVIDTQSRVTRINTKQCEVEVSNRQGETVKHAYSRLVLALGADPITAKLEGDAVNEVLSVNDLADYAMFRRRLASAQTVAIMGAGLIGCEFANDLRNAGLEVHVVEPNELPLARFLPKRAAKTLRDALSDIGVNWHFGHKVTCVRYSSNDNKVTLNCSTSGADSEINLNADIVLSAIGLLPRIDLAKEAGIKVNCGIVVDRFLRTNIENVFALGDCAEVEGLVSPFVMPLMNAARALAKNLAKQETKVVYPAMPVFVKTLSFPVVVLPPPPNVMGEWHEEGDQEGVRAVFYDSGNTMRGFALTGNRTGEKNTLVKEIPGLII